LQATYPVDPYPRDVAVGDLNDDGVQDIVSTSDSLALGGTLNVLLGNADGTYAPGATYAVPDFPASLALGDLNKDGALDVVASADVGVSILVGNGDGTFADPVTILMDYYASDPVLEDLDQDGFLDLVVIDDYPGAVYVWLGNGDATFGPATVYGMVYEGRIGHGGPQSLALGDVTSDDIPDLVVGYSCYGISVLTGTGDGTFTSRVDYSLGIDDYRAIVLGDVDSNGTQDIVVAGYNGTISVLTGDGLGVFALHDTAEVGLWCPTIALDDVTGDGIQDIVTSRVYSSQNENGLLVLPGNGDGTFEAQVITEAGSSLVALALAELSGDGFPDVVVANKNAHEVSVLLNHGSLMWHTPFAPTPGPVDTIRFHFPSEMQATTFSIAEDITRFTGPEGPLTATGFNWIDSRTLDVTFDAQCRPGAYQMVVGPEILNLGGQAMDLDRDGTAGETPDDQYTATFTIAGPHVSGHSPAGRVAGPVDAVRLEFNQPMDEASFSLADDITTFTGPDGPLEATGYQWLDFFTLEITFQPQSTVGLYELVIGPEIADLWSNFLDQDIDLVPCETPDDQYTASFQIAERGLLSVSISDSYGLPDDASLQFGTPLSEFRQGAADSPLVRPNYPDTRQYFEVTNEDFVALTLSEVLINAPNVSIDPSLTSSPDDDLVLQPGESKQFQLAYAPDVPNFSNLTAHSFALADGLIISTDAPDAPELHVELIGASTYNSDVTYDGKVNLSELGILNVNFGRSAGNPDWDPTADVNGDGTVNLGELGALNVEAWSDGITPTVASELSNDTAPAGTVNNDGITSDPAISGSATDDDGIVDLLAGVDTTDILAFIDILADMQPDGSLALSRTRLEEINGAPLQDGLHTFHLLATDALGNEMHQSLLFTLDTQSPELTGKTPDNVTADIASLNIDVIFSEPVFGVDASDLLLSGDGAVGASVGTPADQGGNVWRFPVAGLTDGVVNVSLALDADDIEDVAGNDLAPVTWSFNVDLDVVVFGDPDLELAVKNELGIDEADPVYTGNMRELTSLSADSNIVDSLVGLEWAVNLNELRLWPGNWSETPVGLSDLTPLSGLTSLEELTLARTGVSETQLGSVVGLGTLHTLDLRYNNIQDISALAGLDGLTTLYLYGNPVTDTTALAGMNLDVDLVPTSADLASTIPELAAALDYSPVRIYEYLYNTIEYEPYAGLMKGSQAVLETKAGNAWDTSVLLEEVLEESGVTARLVTGQVTAFGYDLFMWLGISNSLEQYRLLSTAGLNPAMAGLSIQFDHTWVEAYLSTGGGDPVWVPFDPVFKFKDYREGVADIVQLVPFDEAGYLSEVRDELPYEYYEDQVATYLAANMSGVSIADVTYNGPIIQKSFHLLPDSLPYNLNDPGTRFEAVANVPLSWKHNGRITITQNDTVLLDQQFVLPEVCLDRITVGYAPIPEHQPIVDSYGGLANTPAGAVDVFPQLRLDGQIVLEGSPVSYLSDIEIELAQEGVNGAHATSNTYDRKAGCYVAVGFNTLQVSDALLARQVRAVNEATLAEMNSQPFDIDDQMGGLLYLAMMKYYRECDLANSSVQALAQFRDVLWKVETGITTSKLATTYEENLMFPVVPKEALIDVAGGTGTAGAFACGWGDQATLEQMHRHGIYNASALEHAIWQELINTESISTIKSLELANECGIPVFTIDTANASTYIPQLTLPAADIASIQSEVDNGSTVVTPRDVTPLGDWTGVGYFVFNPAYDAAKISGGYNSGQDRIVTDGGSTTGLPDLYSWSLWGNWGRDQAFAGDPVNIANGNLVHNETDIWLPGIGFPLEFARHYDSQSDTDIGIGAGWVHTYSDYLAGGEDDAIVWIDDQGHHSTFTPDGSGGYIVPEGLDGTFAADGDEFVYREKDGTTHRFDNTGKLIELRDRNDNALILTYDGNDHLFRVTDSHTPSRYLEFSWTGDHITAMSDFAGRTWSYAYSAACLVQLTGPSDTQTPAPVTQYEYYDQVPLEGMMHRITAPDGGTTTYSYYPNKRVFEVVDPEGYTHHYYYNLRRSLTTFVNERAVPTVYIHNDKGNALKVIQVDRSSESYTWADGRMQSWTDPFGNSETYEYNDRGNLTRQVDRDGVETVMTYEPEFSNPLTITRPGGRVTTYGYDAHGNRTLITNALGNLKTMTYDSRGLTLTETRPEGNLTPDPDDYTTTYTYNNAGQILTETTDLPSTVTYTYDTRGNLFTLTDANSNTTTYTYDVLDRVTETVDALSHATTFTYDAVGNLLTTTDALGNTVTHEYDLKGNKVRTIRPDATFVTFVYSPTSQTVLATDELGRPTRYSHDVRDRLAQTLYADGARTFTRYDGASRVVDEIDARDYRTRYTYDAADRLLTTTNAIGQTTSFAYDAVGNLETVTDPRGAVTTNYYDLLNRVTQIRGEGGYVVTMDYDANGNETLVTRYDVTGLDPVPDDPRTIAEDARKRIVETVYDVADRAVERIDPLGNSTYTEYDAGGRVVRTTDERGKDTMFGYDEVNNLVSRTNPDGGTTTFAYDEVHRQVGLTMPEGGHWQQEYDSRGRLIAKTDPLGRRTEFSYDAVDTVLRQLNPDGSWIENTYDSRNRLLRRDRSDGSYDWYQYDASGNLTLAENEHAYVVLYYDGLNRRSGEVAILGDEFLSSIDYAFDEAGNLVLVESASQGYSIEYSYDLAGRLTDLYSYDASTWMTCGSAQITYNGFGQRETITYGNWYADSFAYDGAGRLDTITYVNSGGTSSLSYSRDAAGNPITVDEDLDGVLETLSIARDDMGRPVTVTATNNPDRNESFTYDLDGNLVDTGALTGMTFDDADQAVSGSDGTYTSDGQGNLILTTKTDGSWIETPHDPSDRMTGILQYDDVGGLVREVTYVYDALDRRVKIVDGDAVTYRVFAFDNAIATIQSDGVNPEEITKYVVGPSLDDVFAANVDGETRYLHRDEIGSIRLVTDAYGTVLATESYSLFGRNVASTGSNDTGLGFTARPVDAETGLIDLRARMYDASMARFYAEDPVSTLSSGTSLYAYAGNLPLVLTDPTGLCAGTSSISWQTGVWNLVRDSLRTFLTGVSVISGAVDVASGPTPLDQGLSLLTWAGLNAAEVMETGTWSDESRVSTAFMLGGQLPLIGTASDIAQEAMAIESYYRSYNNLVKSWHELTEAFSGDRAAPGVNSSNTGDGTSRVPDLSIFTNEQIEILEKLRDKPSTFRIRPPINSPPRG